VLQERVSSSKALELKLFITRITQTWNHYNILLDVVQDIANLDGSSTEEIERRIKSSPDTLNYLITFSRNVDFTGVKEDEFPRVRVENFPHLRNTPLASYLSLLRPGSWIVSKNCVMTFNVL
jgi:hypothetical protein